MDEFNIYDFDIVSDIVSDFDEMSARGERSIESTILEQYEDELSDSDDSPLVYISLALCQLKHTGNVSAKIKKRTLEGLESQAFIQRFLECEEDYYHSFCEWKLKLIQDIENGVAVVRKHHIKSRRVPKMNVGDIFLFDTEKEELKEYGTICLIVVGHMDHYKPNLPIVYLVTTKDTIRSKEDMLSANLFFCPVSKRFDTFDYRRILCDGSIADNLNLKLRFIGNFEDYPRPKCEAVPPNRDWYALLSFFDLKSWIETSFQVLNSPFPFGKLSK